jgi:PII-like signaling protein
MPRIDGEQVLMRIFIGESDQWKRRPLYIALLELFRSKQLAGATVLKGVAGFGPDSILHTAGFLKLSADLPLVIEVVDSQEHLEAVLADVDRMMSGGLITMEKVRVVRYQQGTAA